MLCLTIYIHYQKTFFIMHEMVTREATLSDLDTLGTLWLTNAKLQAEYDGRFCPSTDGLVRWMDWARSWLANDLYTVILVAERDDYVLGYIAVQIEGGRPGMLPERVGRVREMVVDQHDGEGVGTVLVDAAKNWFYDRYVSVVLADVPRRASVQQAFWRAIGATVHMEVMYVKLGNHQ